MVIIVYVVMRGGGVDNVKIMITAVAMVVILVMS